MARRIDLSQIGSYSQEKYEQLLRVVVLETETRLKLGSPVDTGRFRGSWVTSENQTIAYDNGPYQPATGQYKGQTNPPRDPTLERRLCLNYPEGRERAGNVYHISNSLPYAEALANGHSTQADAGWIDIIARQMTDLARQQADAIGRRD